MFVPSSYSEISAGFKLMSQSKTIKQLRYLLVHTLAHTDPWLVPKILAGKINNLRLPLFNKPFYKKEDRAKVCGFYYRAASFVEVF